MMFGSNHELQKDFDPLPKGVSGLGRTTCNKPPPPVPEWQETEQEWYDREGTLCSTSRLPRQVCLPRYVWKAQSDIQVRDWKERTSLKQGSSTQC